MLMLVRVESIPSRSKSRKMVLEDYKEIVGFCAMFTTMVQMLSGTLICRSIYMKGSARGVDPMPFLGGVGLCILMLRYAWMLAPLVHLEKVIQTKNTEILPFPLIFMGTLVSFQWLLYGIIIDNVFVIFQNAVGLTLNVAQLSLFVIFPSKMSQVELLNEQSKED
ncbi:sugar transporter SWEET1 isoform X2 [Temnothorax americanus]|uniref:sugar transporter SWEET1 isoform X2 n=1 Tax=Temnothorax americanus TaxID=1964332 RepID=UPI00406781A0